MPLLEVALKLGHEAVLDVQDTLADLADSCWWSSTATS